MKWQDSLAGLAAEDRTASVCDLKRTQRPVVRLETNNPAEVLFLSEGRAEEMRGSVSNVPSKHGRRDLSVGTSLAVRTSLEGDIIGYMTMGVRYVIDLPVLGRDTLNNLAIALTVGLTCVAGTAFAQDDSQDAQDTGAVAELRQQLVEGELTEQDERMQEVVCKTDKITGSLVKRRRTCMTRAEWDEQDRQVQQGLQDFNRGASGAPGCISMYDAACGTAAPMGSMGSGL